MSDRTDIDMAALRQTLLDRQAELKRLSEISAESREAVELDQTRQGRLSRMDAMQQQEMAKEADRRRQIDGQKIESALKRMETDDYGYCAACDEPIASKRLELDPAVSTCIQCAK